MTGIFIIHIQKFKSLYNTMCCYEFKLCDGVYVCKNVSFMFFNITTLMTALVICHAKKPKI